MQVARSQYVISERKKIKIYALSHATKSNNSDAL